MQGRSLGRRGTKLFWRFYRRRRRTKGSTSSQIVHAQRFGQFGIQQREARHLKNKSDVKIGVSQCYTVWSMIIGPGIFSQFRVLHSSFMFQKDQNRPKLIEDRPNEAA